MLELVLIGLNRWVGGWVGRYQAQVEGRVSFVLGGHLVEHVPCLLGLVRQAGGEAVEPPFLMMHIEHIAHIR